MKEEREEWRNEREEEREEEEDEGFGEEGKEEEAKEEEGWIRGKVLSRWRKSYGGLSGGLRGRWCLCHYSKTFL